MSLLNSFGVSMNTSPQQACPPGPAIRHLHILIHRPAAAIFLATLLGGCAGPVAERAFEDVAARTEQATGARPAFIRTDADEAAVRAAMDNLLARPLSADDAVRIALLNNRRLQVSLAGLGLGAADLTSAWRPANPGFSFGRFERGAETEIERKLTIDALSLLVLPLRAGIEERRFERTKLHVATETLSLAAETRRAWYAAVAAAQTEKFVAQVREAADLQVELSRRMRAAGNFSLLDLTRGQLHLADAAARQVRSRVAAAAAREKLARLMGLSGRDLAFQLPERLPVLPPQPGNVENIEATVMAGRLDIQMAQADLEAMRKSANLTRMTRMVNVLETGFARNSKSAERDQTGYEITLEVPIFDLGDAKATRAEAAYMQAVHRLADMAITARSEAREAYGGYRAAYELAQHYQTKIVPLRQKVSEEMLMRYNGMLVSVFELLADQRDQISEISAAVEALRDFWIADTDLAFVSLAPADAAAAGR